MLNDRQSFTRDSLLAIAWLMAVAFRGAAAQDDLQALEEQAMQSAAARVAASTVSIETVGGLEKVDGVLFGTGPTTGLVVSEDGYIISSAFNFAQKPSSILVGLPGGQRLPAQLVATDHNRMLVLLKVQSEQPLTVPEPAPESEMQVGQWTIAVGRAYDVSQINVSVGIISALNRVWGKAIQTDAKISPSNYGGPLVDIRGRTLGVLVPLSPQKTGEVTGVEWYDSGIGFAVPLEHINQILPRMKEGTDLYPGVMGISLAGKDMFADEPIIGACRPNSPAYKAGLKAGDKILQIGDQALERQAQLLHEVNRRYAGDKLRVIVARGEERIERELELVDKLEPYQRAFLGLLPLRDPPANGEAEFHEGAIVRHVYPDSPAARAGIQPGDHITRLGERAILGRDDLAEAMSSAEIGQKLTLTVVRGSETLTLELLPAVEPDTTPGELPAARAARPEPAVERPAVGPFTLKVAELKQDALVFVPAAYDPQLRYGVVIWLHPPGGFQDDLLLAQWREACQSRDLILLAPRASDKSKWQKEDLEFVRKALDQIGSTYQVDPLRIASYGQDIGGAMAYAVAFANRDVIRGVVAINSPLSGLPPENEPMHRLSFFMTSAGDSKHAQAIQAALKLLRDRKYSVTLLDQGAESRDLNEREFAEALRWIDSLDRL